MTSEPLSILLGDDHLAAASVATEVARHIRGIDKVHYLGEGQDFRVFAAGEHVLRFPKHAHAAAWLAREHALLGVLAARLDLGVPRHVECFGPGVLPVPWVVAQRIRGTPGHLVERPGDIPGLAEALGRTLATLHRTPAEDVAAVVAPAAGHDSWEPVAYRQTVRDDLEALGGSGDFSARLQARGMPAARAARAGAFLAADTAPSAAPPSALRLVHGDLDPEHLVVGPPPRPLVGILDWSDARFADPARDLAAVLSWGGADFLERALAAYDAPLDPEARIRVPYLARCCAIDAFFSTVDEDPALHRCALRMLDHAFGPEAGAS